jgi:hypothetical protein
MSKPLTPGRLGLIGAAVLVLSLVVPFVAGYAGMPEPPEWVWLGMPIAGALMLVGAGVAKAVQIGVRSAKD